MRHLFIALTLACGVSAPVPAAETPAQGVAAPSQEAIAAALPLFESEDFEEQVRASVMHMTNVGFHSELESLKLKGVELPDDLLARLRQVVFEEGDAMVDDLMPTVRLDAAMIYARYFTVAELRELKILMARPVLKKAERLSPQMMAELSQIGIKAALARQPAMEEKVKALVEQWAAEQAAAEDVST